MKKLPIGISTLEKIRADDYIYIDKTHHVAQLVNSGTEYFFLSRPRRFGKSLLLDTLKQAFLGNKDAFKGLHLENNWDWNVKHPIIYLNFGGASTDRSEAVLREYISQKLNAYADEYGIELKSKELSNVLQELVEKLHGKYNTKVVLLVDEYDKPILDVIDDEAQATINRDILKGLYGAIKNLDQYLKFVFLTGVSKFSKVSVFSGLNNLNDITLDPHYADICGYTHTEMEKAFTEYLVDGNVDKEKLKRWYNGYDFTGVESQKVYNPFDILLFCNNDYRYKNYWFETATPTFLIKLLQKKQYYVPSFESVLISDSDLSTFEVNNIPINALLFQTGYLTVKKISQIGTQYGYILSYPNLEVKASLNDSLFALGTNIETKGRSLARVDCALKSACFDDLKEIFNAHFSSIPHDWYRNNPMGQYEGFYAGIIYSCFAALGYDLTAEDTTSTGRIDLTIQMPDKILIIEFKLAKYGSADDAIKQIIDKKYADKFKADKRPVYLIGMSFDDQTKTMADIKWCDFDTV